MSYIGNGKSLLIIGSNTKDDLIPNEADKKNTFILSQEVPGGYESNITVLRQKYITKSLLQSSNKISIATGTLPESSPAVDVYKLSCTDSGISSVLAQIVPGGDLTLSVQKTPPSASTYNNTFKVVRVDYLGSSVDVYLVIPAGSPTNETVNTDSNPANNTSLVTVSFGHVSDWDVLEPEKDYIISGTGTIRNRQIELTEYPRTKDKVYVLHKGEATYNLVPSVGSVGANELSENLRSFTCDRYEGNGSKTTFALSGTDVDGYTVVDAKSLLVTVDDRVYDSDGIDSQGASVVGKWKLDLVRDASNRQTITFNSGSIPGQGSKIRILHLGFSTVSRRAGFAQGTVPYQPAAGSVGSNEIQNEAVTGIKLAPASVSTTKLANSSVTSEKILLTNNVDLKGSSLSGAPINLLKVTSTDKTALNGSTETLFCIAGNETISLTSSALKPVAANVSVGTTSNKFADSHFSGTVNAASAVFTGNVQATTINTVNITTLKNNVDALTTSIPDRFGIPIGSIVMWPSGADASIPKNWRRCDGRALNTYTFKKLHKIIGGTYGGQNYEEGRTDQSNAQYNFNLPDLRSRFPVGANPSATNSLTVGEDEGATNYQTRTIEHTHVAPGHTHTFEHTHYVPGHYHSVGANTGSNLQISQNSGAHTTRLDHSHANLRVTENAILNPSLDKIEWSATSGTHTHTGTTNMCSSLEHVHRSWPYLNTNIPTSNNPNITKLGGAQWYEKNGNSTVVVDTKNTGYVRNDDKDVINRHTHEIPSSPYRASALDAGGKHTHSNSAYSSSSADLGDRTVSTGTSDTTYGTPLVRYSGSVSAASSNDLSSHTHRIQSFYTDFPYIRTASDIVSSSGTDATGGYYHSDIDNRRTTLEHNHGYTTPANQGQHSHDIIIQYKGTITDGAHTHPAGSFSGTVGQYTPISTTQTVKDRTSNSNSQTGGHNGDADFETSSPCKDVAGVNKTTSSPIWDGSNNNTLAAVSPYLVLDFIIKVSDEEQ